DLEVAAGQRELAVGVLPDRADVRRCGRCVEPGARRQGDVDDDRSPAGKREAALARHQQRAVTEVDAHLLGGLDVVTARFVTRAHLDDGVVAVTGDEPHGAGGDLHSRGDGLRGIESGHCFLLVGFVDQRTQPLKCLPESPRGPLELLPPSVAATARTSHAFTDSPSPRAAASTPDRRCSGSRSVTRQVPPSSSDSGTTAGGVWDGSATSSMPADTVNSGSRPRSRTSTEPGARSRVICSAASESASKSANRIADSSGAVNRSTSASASCPPAAAATASSWRTASTYGCNSMVSW